MTNSCYVLIDRSMKTVVCKYCGAKHECSRMSNRERAEVAAAARNRKPMESMHPGKAILPRYDDGDGDHD